MAKKGHIAGKKVSRRHTSVTEAASEVLSVVRTLAEIKRISPGEIRQNKGNGARRLTITHTNAGLDLLITGDAVQKVAVSTESPREVTEFIKNSKELRRFSVTERERKPGI